MMRGDRSARQHRLVRQASAASGTFSPLSLSPVLWLRADLGITLNGDNVSAWADQSGNGYNVTQGTAASQPLLATSVTELGSKPAVSFDGVDDVLFRSATMAALPVGSTGRTALLVYVCRSTTFSFRFLYQASIAPFGQSVGGGGVGANGHVEGNYFPPGSAEVVGTAYYTSHAYDGSNVTQRVNGAAVTGGSVAASSTGSPSVLAVGAYDNSATFKTQTDIAELVICASNLTAGQIAAWESYVEARYAL